MLPLIDKVRKRGVGVVLITHNARHALQVGGAVAVLIQGRMAARFARGEKTREGTVSLMEDGEDLGDLMQYENDGPARGASSLKGPIS